MSELTRDEIIECAINCAACNAYCHGCAISDFRGCENATSPAIRSLRDDYNAEIEKNKRLEAEIERLKAAIQTYNSGDVPPDGYSPF